MKTSYKTESQKPFKAFQKLTLRSGCSLETKRVSQFGKPVNSQISIAPISPAQRSFSGFASPTQLTVCFSGAEMLSLRNPSVLPQPALACRLPSASLFLVTKLLNSSFGFFLLLLENCNFIPTGRF